MNLIQKLRLTSHEHGSKEGAGLDSAMFFALNNICELAEQDDCITPHGIYFGTPDPREPKFCPRHFFSDLGYDIVPNDGDEDGTAIVTGARAETPEDYRELVAYFLDEDPSLIELWEKKARSPNASDHEKKVAKYGREFLSSQYDNQ